MVKGMVKTGRIVWRKRVVVRNRYIHCRGRRS